MAKVTPEQQAIQALTQALADPTPKVLFGSAKKPGMFAGSSQPIRKAAQLCLDEKWLEPTGEFDGKGKTRKETYRVTPAGAQAAIERSEPVDLLKQVLFLTEALAKSSVSIESVRQDLMRQQQTILDMLQKQQEVTQHAMKQQHRLLETALARLRSPAAPPTPPAPARSECPSSPANWREEALQYMQRHQTQHIGAFCSLPDLYAGVVGKHGVSIGQFHDVLRDLVQSGQVRLHPFTGSRYALEREEYALLAGKEIMYYAERLAQS